MGYAITNSYWQISLIQYVFGLKVEGDHLKQGERNCYKEKTPSSIRRKKFNDVQIKNNMENCFPNSQTKYSEYTIFSIQLVIL